MAESRLDQTTGLLQDQVMVEIPLEQVEQVEQIDTAAILRRLENKTKLKSVYETYKTIYCKERSKDLLPAGVAVLGISAIGGFAYFLYWFTHPQQFLKQGMPDFSLKYANTFISGLNVTCGVRLPLTGDACQMYEQFGYGSKSYCTNIAWRIGLREDDIAEYHLPHYIAKNQSCMQAYPTDHFCDWRLFIGYASDCADYAWDIYQKHFPEIRNNCSAYVDVYQSTKLVTILPDILNGSKSQVTCGEVLPLSGLCYESVSIWHGLRYNMAVQCGDSARHICKLSSPTFDTTIPQTNYSCKDIYSLPSVITTCHEAATSACADMKTWSRSPLLERDDDWWETMRALLLMGSSIAVTIIVLASLLTFLCARRWLNQKHKVSELAEEEQQQLSAVWSIYNPDIEPTDADIADILAREAVNDAEVEEDKKEIKERRLSFMRGREDPGSTVPDYLHLPKEIAHKILAFGGLFSKPPIEGTIVNGILVKSDYKPGA